MQSTVSHSEDISLDHYSDDISLDHYTLIPHSCDEESRDEQLQTHIPDVIVATNTSPDLTPSKRCAIKGCANLGFQYCDGRIKYDCCTKPNFRYGTCYNVICKDHIDIRSRAITFTNSLGCKSRARDLRGLQCKSCLKQNNESANAYCLASWGRNLLLLVVLVVLYFGLSSAASRSTHSYY
jgi:hypothetical protein